MNIKFTGGIGNGGFILDGCVYLVCSLCSKHALSVCAPSIEHQQIERMKKDLLSMNGLDEHLFTDEEKRKITEFVKSGALADPFAALSGGCRRPCWPIKEDT